MIERPTIDWLRRQALTVLAELMTSDDDFIALQAAQVTLDMFKQDGPQEAEKEQRVVINFGDRSRGEGRSGERAIDHSSAQNAPHTVAHNAASSTASNQERSDERPRESGLRPAFGAEGDTPKLRAVPGSGLRTTLGQDRSGENRGS